MSLRHLFSKRVVAAASVPIAMVASGAMVWHASYSAFSSTTTNPTNNWAAGTVNLTDDDSGTAMFNATGLKPGSTGNKCITVTSNGTLPSVVKLYSTTGSYSTTKALADNLTITVDEGSGPCGTFTSTAQIFNGSLTTFSGKTSFSNGVGSWNTVGGPTSETKVYKITYTLSPTTPDSAQGGTAAVGFTWEAQNS
jgi:Camelysin metallo-endopeptidase